MERKLFKKCNLQDDAHMAGFALQEDKAASLPVLPSLQHAGIVNAIRQVLPGLGILAASGIQLGPVRFGWR